MEVIVGTAGHIDHGKTALVRALTGVDADRLPEEKRRGITVDLGFAEMSVGDIHFGFIDVPGHERFVKNMLAGASGIDIVILVVAANEGVMPQTREHFDICRLLGIKNGVIALTKADLVDPETLEFAQLEIGELVADSFLAEAPIVSVSSQTGHGIDRLKDELLRISNALTGRDDSLVARLPIDRSFTVKGFGAVVTGTLASGQIEEGAEMELFPQGRKLRVRGLQTHGRAVSSATGGQRVAVNLGGIDHSEITRGMLLAERGTLRLTQIIDAEIDVLPGATRPVRSRQRVRLHIGTAEELARVQVLTESGEIAPGQKGFAQLRLERPIVVIPGERFIIRTYSPSATVAGGSVIDAHAAKHRKKEFCELGEALAELRNARKNDAATMSLIVNAQGTAGASFEDLQANTGLKRQRILNALAASSASIVNAGDRFVSLPAFESLLISTEAAVADFHKREPLSKGMPREALRESVFAFLPDEIFSAVISELAGDGRITIDRETVRLAAYQTEFSPAEKALNDKIAGIFRQAGLAVPKLDDALADAIAGTRFTTMEARKFFQRFLDSGEIVKVTDDFYFSRESIDSVIADVRKYAAGTTDRSIDVSQFKEIAGISRKYAIPLLEYFDRTRVTQRVGDKRIVLQ